MQRLPLRGVSPSVLHMVFASMVFSGKSVSNQRISNQRILGQRSLVALLLLTSLAWAGHRGKALAQPQTTDHKPTTGDVYRPIPLTPGNLVKDSLSEKDIPTGKGSFARDYLIDLNKGDQIAIDLTSENFDTVVTLMTPNGTTMGENDDGPDGGTNSLLFMRIVQSGSYIVRVQAFGQAKGGPFTLKLTHLKPSGRN